MEYRAIQKNIGDSPRKMRLVAGMVRNMNPQEAIEVLKFTNRAAAEPLMKAIKTAVANASTSTDLFFKSIEINEGMKMRRYRVGTAGRGRGRPYKKRFSQIKIVLTDDASQQPGANKKMKANLTETKRKGGKQTQTVVGDSAVETESTDKTGSESGKK